MIAAQRTISLKLKITCMAVVTLALLGGCSEQSDNPHVIEVQAVSCAIEPSPCQTIRSEDTKIDRYMVFSVAFTDPETGAGMGTDDGYCLWVKHSQDRLICTKSASFKAGSINYGGLFVPSQKKNTFSIHGGTGAYKNAHGIVHATEVRNAFRFQFIVTVPK